MSIAPPSDIVLDVAQAADPQRLQAATERLARLASGAPVGSEDFGTALRQIRSGATPSVATQEPPTVPNDHPTRVTAAGTSPYQKFEAMVLQSFVETMLPKDGALFGDAASAGAYRSMLADQIATQLARSGRLGIAKAIEGTEGRKAAAQAATVAQAPDASG